MYKIYRIEAVSAELLSTIYFLCKKYLNPFWDERDIVWVRSSSFNNDNSSKSAMIRQPLNSIQK